MSRLKMWKIELLADDTKKWEYLSWKIESIFY